MKLNPNVRTSRMHGLVFIFNPPVGSWVAVTPQAYDYLERLVRNGHDPLALGLSMGFSKEEIEEFLTLLFERGILQEPQYLNTTIDFGLQSCYLHVTQACNLQCRTCYSWRENRNDRKQELSLEEMEGILSELSRNGLKTLVISGGEPLMRRDLPEILRLAKQRYQIPKIVLITNGTLVTPKIAERLAPWVDEVSVSLDGPEEAINAYIRGRGNFDRAIRGVRFFRDASVKSVSLLSTLTHYNLPYVSDFRDLAEQLGVGLSFSMFVGVGAGSSPESEDLYLTPEDLVTIGKFIMKGEVRLQLDTEGNDVLPFAQNNSEVMKINLDSRVGCGVGARIIAIDYDGGVYPCHMLMRPELRMGTLLQDSLEDILLNSTLGKFFRLLDVDSIDVCKKCSLRYFCGGGCRASAYSSSGSLTSHDPACALYRTAIGLALEPLLAKPRFNLNREAEAVDTTI